MIRDTSALKQFVDQSLGAGVSAIDTEFVWERTYYPGLGLIQLGTNGLEPALLDPLVELDTTPLAELVADAGVVKILHDARQDLWILRRYCGANPRNVFDTRIAAGFAGMPATLSLAALHERLLDIVLPKTESRTNWLKRPLTDDQLAYAADDVRHLARIRELILEEVDRRDRSAWLAEELATLEDPQLYVDPQPRDYYQRVKGAGRLRSSQLAVLREVATWREELAQRLDRTRGFVLHDKFLLGIASECPQSRANLGKLRLPRRTFNRNADEILEAVARGLEVPKADRPRTLRGGRPDAETTARINLAMDTLRQRAAEFEMDSAFVATKAEVTALARADAPADTPSRLLSGWRREVAGDAILAAIK